MSLKLGASYFGVKAPEFVENDLNEMKDAGCDVVLHTFSERDQKYLLETTREIVELSKKKDLETYISPWGVAGVFGGEAFSQYIVHEDDTRQVLSDGELAPAACLNNDKFRSFMKEWIEDAVDIGGDVIFWDEPHFFLPSWYPEWYDEDSWACRCHVCQDIFEEKYGYPMPEEENGDVEEFKKESIFDFLGEMMDKVKSEGAKNALCLLPEWEDIDEVEEKWNDFASIDSLDVFGSDPYWLFMDREFSEYEELAEKVKELADKHGKEAQIWIQAFKVDSENEKDLRKAIEVAYDKGIRNIMSWGYRGTAYISSIRSENPDNVWSIIKSSYKDLRDKS